MQFLDGIINPLFIDLRHQNSVDEMLKVIFHCCKEKFILIGFSIGGYVAQEFALQYTNRLLGLALIGTSADAYTEEEKAYQMHMMKNVKEHNLNKLSMSSLRKFLHPDLHNNNIIVDLIQDMAKQSGANVFLNQHAATINRRCRLLDLSNLICPTTVICGREDQIVKIDDAEKMARTIPNAELNVIENCGHMIPLEQNKILNELLYKWINRLMD